MPWELIANNPPPIGRPVLVRTIEIDAPLVAFVSSDNIWYKGGALVQTVGTVLGATPIEWCEPPGDAAL